MQIATTTEKYKLIIDRINLLNPKQQALWGKMNVAQMLLHCQAPLKVVFEELKLKPGLISFLFGKMAKKELIKNKAFKKNLPTAASFNTRKTNPDFVIERQKLIQYIKRFQQADAEAVAKNQHPLFGKMTYHEWDLLQWKHLDHHLRQFGV
jgi:hypothetical protein